MNDNKCMLMRKSYKRIASSSLTRTVAIALGPDEEKSVLQVMLDMGGKKRVYESNISLRAE